MNLSSPGAPAKESGGLNVWTRLAIALILGALLGLVIASLSPGSFWTGWLAAAVLLVAALFVLVSAWQWAGGGRMLALLVGLAFLLRL
ncbi:MAG: hypothetical protein EHM21_09040, partial [Chloroflexi bacterium]